MNTWQIHPDEPPCPYKVESEGEFRGGVQRVMDLQLMHSDSSTREISRQYPLCVVEAAANEHRVGAAHRGLLLEIVEEKKRAIAETQRANRHREQIELLKATERRLSAQIAELKIGNAISVEQLASAKAHHATAQEHLTQSKPKPWYIRFALHILFAAGGAAVGLLFRQG